MAINNNNKKFEFVILFKYKKNAAIRGDNRFFLDNDNFDKLTADKKKREIIKNKNNIIFITDEEINISENNKLNSNNPKSETINSR